MRSLIRTRFRQRLQGDKHQGQELQRKVEQYVAILRLFAVGGVRSSEYQMSSDSLIDWTARGTIGSNFRHLPARETYFIKTGDEAKLMQFVRVLAGALPKDLYDSQGRTDHLTIAFKRYSEALLEATIIESRITTAMMGLEALFLDDSKELAYKLAVRISKAMSFLNHNPFAVRDFVYKAYGIRSTFAHGGHLTYKETKKLEKRYGGVEKILQAVLDYLRISILVMILSHQDKEMFIDLIDDALVDRQKSTDLENRLTQLRDFV